MQSNAEVVSSSLTWSMTLLDTRTFPTFTSALKATNQSLFSLLSSCLCLLCEQVLLRGRQEAASIRSSYSLSKLLVAAQTRTCCSLSLGISINGAHSPTPGPGMWAAGPLHR